MAEAALSEIARRAEDAKVVLSHWMSPSPLISSKDAFGGSLSFKCENFQRTGSFKIRGATNKLAGAFAGPNGRRQLFTASSGNHGIACAQAAQWLDMKLTVILPLNTSAEKVRALAQFDVDIIRQGDEAGQAERHARQLAERSGGLYVSPYNDVDVVAGQGTIGLELLECFKGQETLNVFVSLGGGGLISGIGSVLKSNMRNVKIWAVSAKNSCAMHESLRAGRVVDVDHLHTFAEGVAGGIDHDTITFGYCIAVVDESLVCDEEEIFNAYRDLALKEGILVEGAAALAYSGYQKSRHALGDNNHSVVILCGGNSDHKKSLNFKGH